MSIWGLSWPWAKKKGRTIESYDKIGRLRVLCIAGGSPVTGEITTQNSEASMAVKVGDGRDSRWTRCPECDYKIRVTGPKAKPRLTVHGADKKT